MNEAFFSSIACELRDFLAFKQSLGFYLNKRAELRLRNFDRFAAQCPQNTINEIAYQWICRRDGLKPKTIETELSLMREFLRFLQRQKPDEVTFDSMRLPQVRVRTKYKPYIFSLKEIRLVLEATKTMRSPPFRAFTFRTLIYVLFCTGLRPGEAIRITLNDVEQNTKAFFIRMGKGRSRWVPFNDDLHDKLLEYLKDRMAISQTSPHSPLFVHPDGRKYTSNLVSWIFRHLFRRAGLKPQQGNIGPRPYDFRHTFAVQRLTQWYREGVDLHSHLPWLSAYMGHEDILGTEVYLHATPELLSYASQRFLDRFNRKDKL